MSSTKMTAAKQRQNEQPHVAHPLRVHAHHADVQIDVLRRRKLLTQRIGDRVDVGCA